MRPSLDLKDYDCSNGLVRVLWSHGDLLVRTATYKDKGFIDKLQKENSYAVGFIQRTIWDKYVFGGQRNFFVLLVEKNLDPVGYTLVTPGYLNGWVKIQQIAVRDDARRLHYGGALVEVIRGFCKRFDRRGAKLRCRVDLESNHFWLALGFTLYKVGLKGSINHVGMKASNDINHWMIELNESKDLFDLR